MVRVKSLTDTVVEIWTVPSDFYPYFHGDALDKNASDVRKRRDICISLRVKYQLGPLLPALTGVPPCATRAPIGGGGACDSSVLPRIRFQVIQHYRNQEAIAAGQSPRSASVFLIIGKMHFFAFHFPYAIYHIFPSEICPEKRVKITLYPSFIVLLKKQA